MSSSASSARARQLWSKYRTHRNRPRAHPARREAATLPPVTLPAKLTRRDVDDAFGVRDEKKSNADEDSGSATGAASSLSGSAYFCASCDAASARNESVRCKWRRAPKRTRLAWRRASCGICGGGNREALQLCHRGASANPTESCSTESPMLRVQCNVECIAAQRSNATRCGKSLHRNGLRSNRSWRLDEKAFDCPRQAVRCSAVQFIRPQCARTALVRIDDLDRTAAAVVLVVGEQRRSEQAAPLRARLKLGVLLLLCAARRVNARHAHPSNGPDGKARRQGRAVVGATRSGGLMIAPNQTCSS